MGSVPFPSQQATIARSPLLPTAYWLLFTDHRSPFPPNSTKNPRDSSQKNGMCPFLARADQRMDFSQ